MSEFNERKNPRRVGQHQPGASTEQNLEAEVYAPPCSVKKHTTSGAGTQDVFRQVRERAPNMELIAGRCGYEVKRGHMILCPFHSEKTPSCRLWDRTWHCFGCGAGGDAINFVQQLYGLSPLDAARRLNADFSLGVPFDRPATPEQHQAAARQAEARRERERIDRWRDEMVLQLIKIQRRANLALSRGEPFADGEVEAIRLREPAAHYEAVLTGSDWNEIKKLFREREVLSAWLSRGLQ